MRTMLMASATLFCLAGLPAAYAQAPDPSAPPAPDSSVASDTPAATDGAAVPGMSVPKHHHHRMRASVPGDTGDVKFAHEPGTGLSGPASMKASNIDGSDSRSAIAPHLPQPMGGESAGPWHYLHAADHALAMKHTGEAQQALEMAETRLLDRSTPVDQAGQPDQGPVVQNVSQARAALGHGDMAGARSAIQMALSHDPHTGDQGGMGMDRPGMGVGGMGMKGGGMSSSMGMTRAGMVASQPGGAPMGNGTPTGATMAPSGAGAAPGASAGAAVGGGAAGVGTADSAGGAK